MKFLLAFILCFGMVRVATASRPIEVELKVLDLYAPKGFDSNDTVEVVVTGYLPNLCYKSPFAVAEKSGNEIKVKIKALLASENIYCPMVIVPFYSTVSLGILDAGEYELKSDSGLKNAVLKIEEAKVSAVDQFIYAQVAHIETDSLLNKVTVVAYNPSDCLVYKSVKLIPSDDGKVLSVLPIMEKVKDFCPLKMTQMNIDFEVPSDISKDNLLLHVRSMDGKSVNTIFHQTVD